MLLLILSVVLLVPFVEGSCNVSAVKIRQTASGRNISVCTLKNGLEILNGSVITLGSCESCTCGEKELSCCGIGHLVGVGPAPPNECKKILDGCNEIMVKKSDETKDCVTGNSILVNSPYTYPYIIPNFSYFQRMLSANNLHGHLPSTGVQNIVRENDPVGKQHWFDTVNWPQHILNANNMVERKPLLDSQHLDGVAAVMERKVEPQYVNTPYIMGHYDISVPVERNYIDRKFTQHHPFGTIFV